MDLDEMERNVVRELQGELPLSSRPFAEIASRIGATEADTVAAAGRLAQRGALRRLAAILAHRRAGYTANAMVVWRVSEERLDEVGRAMARRAEVTHCCSRPPKPGWPFNLYTMIHGRTEDACRRLAGELAEELGLEGCEMLFSREEYKKTSPVYVKPC